MCIRLRSALPVVGLLLAAGNAAAVCPIQGFYLYVGDTASDNQCNYDDIQSAINNASTTCRTNIVITPEHTYTTQHLEIGDKSITLIGSGNACNYQPGICDPAVGCGGGGGGGAPPAPAITLHGNGAASVLYVHGNSHVTVQSLALSGGGGTDYGGGIHFSGTGSLTLVDSTLTLNSAAYGGGIQFNGSGGNATLTLGAGTIIDENTASADGGGIQVNGTARLFALAPYTFIGYNQAGSQGGGVAVAGPARGDIGSPGYNGTPVVSFNGAADGGGIAVDGDADGYAQVRVFTADANHPVAISDNTAAGAGGAVYLKSFMQALPFVANDASFCAFNYALDGNIAQDGTAIYGAADSDALGDRIGSSVYLNYGDGTFCGPEYSSSLGALACAPGIDCSTMNGNVAEDNANNPKPGAVIFIENGSDLGGVLHANGVVMRGNQGAHALRAGDGSWEISNCLVADNTFTAERVRIENGGGSGSASIDSCTFVGNSVGASSVIYSAHDLLLTNTIVDEADVTTLNYTASPANLTVSYVLSTETASLSGGTGVALGEPTYVNPYAGDYHLAATSLGVDYAPPTGGFDLDGLPRDVDLVPVPDIYGPRDIGAYERQYLCAADTLFCNGFDTYQ